MNYGTATRFSGEQVLQMAERFFGSEKIGLRAVERRPDGLELAGPGGRVTVRVQHTDDATEVFLTTEGFDYQVRQFMVEIYEEAHPRETSAAGTHSERGSGE